MADIKKEKKIKLQHSLKGNTGFDMLLLKYPSFWIQTFKKIQFGSSLGDTAYPEERCNKQLPGIRI